MNNAEINVAHIDRKALSLIEKKLIEKKTEWDKKEEELVTDRKCEIKREIARVKEETVIYEEWVKELQEWAVEEVTVTTETKFLWMTRVKTQVMSNEKAAEQKNLSELEVIEMLAPNVPEQLQYNESYMSFISNSHYRFDRGISYTMMTCCKPRTDLSPYEAIEYPKLHILEEVHNLLFSGADKYSVSSEIAKEMPHE